MKLDRAKKSTDLKPTVIPEGFVLVVDTRETEMLFERPPKGLLMVRDTLPQGDYSIRGMESIVTIERKKLSDFYAYIGKEYQDHTIKKLKSMLHYGFVGLVIEASEEDIFSPQLYSQVSYERARAFILSWEVRYGFHFYCSRSRKNLERWILDRLVKLYSIIREVT